MAKCPACQADVADGAKFCTLCGAKLPKTQSEGDDPLLGRIFARNFRIEKLLGVGGMGKVYRATQLSLDKPVVLKLLHAHYAHDETLVARFHREARAASRLNHPNSINIIDFGQDDDGTLFMAMEFLHGRDLFTVLQTESPVPEDRVARIVRQVCSALAEAHNQGVIHRDLKPENIMVEDRPHQKDFVKVLDFGIAKIQDPEGKDTRTLTAQGMVCGTPEYMAPEQARGEILDARTDVYAIGVLMYQLVTGQLPFQADNAIGIVTKHIVEKPRPLRETAPDRAISPEMEAIVLRCMAKKREERFQNILELSDALEPIALRGSVGRAVSAPSSPLTDSMPVASTQLVDRTGPQARPRKRTNRSVVVGVVISIAVLASASVVGSWAYREYRSRLTTGNGAQATDAATAIAVVVDAGRTDGLAPVLVRTEIDAALPAVRDAAAPGLKTPSFGDAGRGGAIVPPPPPPATLNDAERKVIAELVASGENAVRFGDTPEGRSKCQQALQKDPANSRAYLCLANAAVKESKFVESCEMIELYFKFVKPRPTAATQKNTRKVFCPGR